MASIPVSGNRRQLLALPGAVCDQPACRRSAIALTRTASRPGPLLRPPVLLRRARLLRLMAPPRPDPGERSAPRRSGPGRDAVPVPGAVLASIPGPGNRRPLLAGPGAVCDQPACRRSAIALTRTASRPGPLLRPSVLLRRARLLRLMALAKRSAPRRSGPGRDAVPTLAPSWLESSGDRWRPTLRALCTRNRHPGVMPSIRPDGVADRSAPTTLRARPCMRLCN
ncbi:hypothetical protein FHR62_003874 [Xanthomonas arboricola]|nr:hypothetical protein [Xanthomonas arboricola]